MSTMISVSDDLMFTLSNPRISYAFRVAAEGILEHLYFGSRVASASGLTAAVRRTHRTLCSEYQGIRDYHLADTPLEYPLFGTSDVRYPALHAVNSDGNTVFSPLYASHRICSDKPELKGLPSARGERSETLIVTLNDPVYALTVELYYTVYSDHDVICRSATITNEGQASIELLHAFSACMDLPADDYELLHLQGSWGREFNATRCTVSNGRFAIESACGASSAMHNPFIALLEKGTTERNGRVYANALMYSGNFAISIEKSEFDDVRVLTGINPFNFNWKLDQGESFSCPEVLQVYTDQGLTAMSHIWHRFIQGQVIPPLFAYSERPTYLNSWEAAYFDLNEETVMRLARKTKSLGLDMLVLDDGWFEGRHDDTTSLGDWTADNNKFPCGIAALTKNVRELGLRFGLWIEPEMVSETSQLFSSHPDWILHVPHRKLSTGRNQYILDLSRADVVDYLFAQMDALLAAGHIDYIKWDMNRNMTEVGSAKLPAQRQRETAHRYMLGLYGLIQRLVTRYPGVLFENCSAGGNRFDLGMLRYMSQGWPSDTSEPIGRLPIINGASYIFPPAIFTSFIGPVPSHQNGRNAPLQTRFHAGFFCGARGISLNEADIARDEATLKSYIRLLKESALDVMEGTFYRLLFTSSDVCWQLTSADEKTIYIGYFHILAASNLPFRTARLQGLDALAEYITDPTADKFNGALLMETGLPLPYVHEMQSNPDMHYMDRGDFSSCLIMLKKADTASND